ncbi:deoxyribose-phosphate aldolase [Natroniella sulfidigena]|uniref:deoxyribose-phosphate aldolase n=1 Tax=Natroniella sulfidigena TaxID=723921 RepID=UPI00200AA115|nr:deoxyribose-phosphate aldolase [Natroniella sulfidigena]MCK8815997.1 deoxyribose-phosphate aldolase [Natroniella sulfidigena]
MDSNQLAAMIDHTILRSEAVSEDIKTKCQEAVEHKFASVCVNPSFVRLASKELADSEVKVCTVVGFPFGDSTSESKAFETRNAIKNGAQEIDMVINLGALKSEAWDVVKDDINIVVREAREKRVVKVIIETCYLTEEEMKKACQIIKEVGADFVKTSTGFGTAGAKVEDIKLIKEVVGDEVGIKASGGIKTEADAVKMIEAGATRIGTSFGVEIVNS